ncbi:hypothetical protein GOV04_03200 [Candidatus Woesearchaeota archaeon]|nr:hypothetical protein [Candidatus Woesearchaeota archaeon]
MKFKNTSSILAIIMLLLIASLTAAIPAGPQILYNSTETAPVTPGTYLNTSGGTFTTLLINGTTQTPRWKAYAGNVTGKLTLDDSTNQTIYDWSLATITGEVYVSRNDTNINWNDLKCANQSTIGAEQSYLNINNSNADSINNTFFNKTHKTFFAAGNSITNSTCQAIATYVNDQAQASSEASLFQEVLLQDSTGNLIFTTLIEEDQQGFDTSTYDFQIIIPEDETSQTPTPYYFYVELT